MAFLIFVLLNLLLGCARDAPAPPSLPTPALVEVAPAPSVTPTVLLLPPFQPRPSLPPGVSDEDLLAYTPVEIKPTPTRVMLASRGERPTATPTPRPVATPHPLTTPIPPTISGVTTTTPGVRPVPAGSAVWRWGDLIAQASEQYGVPADLIARVMYVESGGNPNATSVAGARGLMQVMPFWFGRGENPYDPLTNVNKGTWILLRNYERLGTWPRAVAAYFGSGVDATGTSTSVYLSKVFVLP